MRNQYPLWKNLFIIATLAFCALYALPNLYGEDPSLQISPTRTTKVDETTRSQVQELLSSSQIQTKAIELDANRLLVRFNDTEAQLKAADLVSTKLGSGFTVALNLAPATPDWLRKINGKPMYLGLDLRGGVHFLLQVDMVAAVRQALEAQSEDFRTILRENKIRYQSVERDGEVITVKFENSMTLNQGYDLLRKERPTIVFKPDESAATLAAQLSKPAIVEIKRNAVAQNTTTLQNRINELGVAEPVIQQQGEEHIVVQLPGVQDTARAKEILGATATLEFRLVDSEHPTPTDPNKAPVGTRLYKTREGRPVLLERKIIVTGNQIVDSSSGLDQQSGSPAVFISLNAAGAKKMADTTRENIGKAMAVVYIENRSETREVDGVKATSKRKVEEVINVATIRDRFSRRFQITGLDSSEEARNLSLLLRAGALAAPVDIVEERTVGPSLGKDNIDKGVFSFEVGFAVVALVMLWRYKLFGMVANLALAMNVVIIVAILSLLQATLTLPGIAGITLTIGMAVDANVLIYERIREELRGGNPPQASIYAGFEKAFGTILDSNITTLIAAMALFLFGSGPVKGFAVTLSIGILTSMFTAIMGSRMLINFMYGNRRLKGLAI